MRLLHYSDNHGSFPRLLGTFDVILNTGDMSPNFDYASDEASKQMFWWEEKVLELKEQIQNHPFLFVLGNHDFFNGFWLEDMLISKGIKAKCLHDQVYTLDGINFYGFPYIPPINGKFAYETTADEMAMLFEGMTKTFNSTYIDVIAAHCPPYNFLDLAKSNRRFGNTQMNTFLDYQVHRDMIPAYYLTGHIHEAQGIMMRNGMLISNAATNQRIIEI